MKSLSQKGLAILIALTGAMIFYSLLQWQVLRILTKYTKADIFIYPPKSLK